MGDRFKKTQAGLPLEVSATAWNAFIDAAQKTKNTQHDELADESAQFRQADIIKIRNDSGIDLPRFSVLGLDAPIFPPSVSMREFTNQVAMAGVTPTTSHRGRFAILLEPVRSGRIARAWASGVCQARVNVEDEDHSCADVTDGDHTKLTSAKHGSAQMLWREGGMGDQWAIVRSGSICGGSSTALSRCDCPEATYEVTPNCIPCGAYGRKMPKYWWLDVLLSEDNAYSDAYCTSTNCATIPTLVKLTNEADAYGNPLCLWTGSVVCFDFELSQSGDYYYIKIWDRNGCLLATLRKHVDSFNCCGVNEEWELVEGSVCNVQIRLRPHECTCCEDEVICPQDGEPLCEDTDCCVLACDLTVDVSNLATIPPPNPGDPIPPNEACGGMNGVYAMVWKSQCTWRFYGIPAGIGTTKVAAKLTLSGRVWTLRLQGENGQVAVFHSEDWNCEPGPITLRFSESESTCPIAGPEPVAIIVSIV